MKKLVSVLVLCVSAMLMSACDTMSLFNTASVTSNYSGLQADYDKALAAVNRACESMSAEDCADLKIQVAIIENIKRDVDSLRSKDEPTLQKLITVENIKAHYLSGKIAWVNIEKMLRAKATLSPEDELLLENYNMQGRMLAASLDALLVAAERKNPNYTLMLEQILQIIGLTARTAALF